MANFADLVIGVNTRALVKGKTQLDKTTLAAGKTELAVDGTGNAFVKAGAKSKASTGAMAAGLKKVHVAAALAAAGIVTVAASTARFISGTVELEKVQAQLGAVILSTGGAAGRSQEQLNQFAAELQGVTNFGDEAINAMQGVLLTFTQIEGVKFDAATTATLDLATAMGTDLKSAALQVGKALNDPVLGMTALSRSGIQFTEAQKDVVKAMVKTNDIAGAQGIILKELETQFGGSAEAARNALGGALVSLRNAFGDLFEVTGPAANSLRLAVEGLVGTITDPRFVAAVQSIGVALFGMAEIGVKGLIALNDAFVFVGDNIGVLTVALAGLAATYIPAAVAGFAAMTAGVTAAGIATGVFTGAVNVARLAIIALGGPLGIVWGILGAGATAWVLWGEKADTGSQAAEEARIAMALLNEALSDFSQIESPAAQGAALGNAMAYKEQAQAALEVAKAELIKSEAMLAAISALPGEDSEVGRRVAQGLQAQSGYAASKALIDSLSGSLTEADGRIKGLATTIINQQIPAIVKATKVVTILGDGLGGKGGKGKGGVAGAAAKASDAIETYASTMAGAAKTMEEMGVEKANILIGGIDSVSNAFGDWIAGGLKDFKGFAKSILSTFTGMLSQMIAMAARNKIMIGLGMSGGGGAAGVANAATGGGGGILGQIGSVGGLLGKIGGIGSALGTGFMSSLGGFATGGLSGGFGAIGAQLSATAAGGFGLSSVAASIGAVAVPLLAVAAIFSFFKKKTKELDSGIRLTVDGMDSLIEGFKVIQTKRFWGLSKKVATSFSELDAEVSGPLETALVSIFTGIAGAAGSLGVGADAFDAFTSQIMISTKGLSEADANKAIEDGLLGLSDDFAAMIPGLAALQKTGEGASTTLTRLSTSLAVVNDVFQSLGFMAKDASLTGAAAASSFAELFGTIDNFVASTASYYDAFYSADEKRADATARLSASLDALGISAIPNDRAGFRALVDTAKTAGDDDLTAALIMLSPSFANLTASVDELSQVMRNQVEERNFATGVDFKRGLSRASNGIEYTPKDSSAEMLVELKALNARVDLLQSTSEFTAANTGATANNTEDQLTVLETTT